MQCVGGRCDNEDCVGILKIYISKGRFRPVRNKTDRRANRHYAVMVAGLAPHSPRLSGTRLVKAENQREI